MKHITPMGWYWLSWFFIGFLVPEVIWLIKNTKNTLSWQFWGMEHINFQHPFDFAVWTPLHWAIGLFLVVFLLWLLLHLVFGIIR